MVQVQNANSPHCHAEGELDCGTHILPPAHNGNAHKSYLSESHGTIYYYQFQSRWEQNRQLGTAFTISIHTTFTKDQLIWRENTYTVFREIFYQLDDLLALQALLRVWQKEAGGARSVEFHHAYASNFFVLFVKMIWIDLLQHCNKFVDYWTAAWKHAAASAIDAPILWEEIIGSVLGAGGCGDGGDGQEWKAWDYCGEREHCAVWWIWCAVVRRWSGRLDATLKGKRFFKC